MKGLTGCILCGHNHGIRSNSFDLKCSYPSWYSAVRVVVNVLKRSMLKRVSKRVILLLCVCSTRAMLGQQHALQICQHLLSYSQYGIFDRISNSPIIHSLSKLTLCACLCMPYQCLVCSVHSHKCQYAFIGVFVSDLCSVSCRTRVLLLPFTTSMENRYV